VKKLLLGIPENDFQDFPAVAPSSDEGVHKETISKATAAISAHVSKFCFHRAIPGIKLSHHVWFKAPYQTVILRMDRTIIVLKTVNQLSRYNFEFFSVLCSCIQWVV
jgi:hypothetical protein